MLHLAPLAPAVQQKQPLNKKDIPDQHLKEKNEQNVCHKMSFVGHSYNLKLVLFL